MQKYAYRGPVLMFGRVVCQNYKAETMAVSAKKALSNITYQFKKENGYTPEASVKVLEKYLN